MAMLNKRLGKTVFCVVVGLTIILGNIFTYAYFFSGLRIDDASFNINWRKHAVIIFESDDWGATRLFSSNDDLKIGKSLLPDRWKIDYEKYLVSTLESPADLKDLFSVLEKHKGGDRIPVVFTANYVVRSPDYERIKGDRYEKFYSVHLPDVPNRWLRGDFIRIEREAIKKGIWAPEYHGMLHADPYYWMALLKNSDGPTRRLFELESYAGMNGLNGPEYNPSQSFDQQSAIIRDGIGTFKNVFGVGPTSSAAPFYVWQRKTEEILAHHGVRVIQGKNHQNMREEFFFDRVMGKVLNITGHRSSNKSWQIRMGDRNTKTGIVYLLRNVEFEPLVLTDSQNIDNTVSQILRAWSLNQPAVVSTHRFNYVHMDNQKKGGYLHLLDKLLTQIKKARPDVLFLTDSEIAQLYEFGYSQRKYGNTIVIRNFSDKSRTASVDIPGSMKINRISRFPRSSASSLMNFDLKQIVIPAHSTYIVQLASDSNQ